MFSSLTRGFRGFSVSPGPDVVSGDSTQETSRNVSTRSATAFPQLKSFQANLSLPSELLDGMGSLKLQEELLSHSSHLLLPAEGMGTLNMAMGALNIEDDNAMPGSFSPRIMNSANDQTSSSSRFNDDLVTLLTAATITATPADGSSHNKLFSSSCEAYQQASTSSHTYRPLEMSDVVEGLQAAVAARSPVSSPSQRPGRQFGSTAVYLPQRPSNQSPAGSPQPTTPNFLTPPASDPATTLCDQKEHLALENMSGRLAEHEDMLFGDAFSSLDAEQQDLKLELARTFLKSSLGEITQLLSNAHRRQKSAARRSSSDSASKVEQLNNQRKALHERLRSLSVKIAALDAFRVPKAPVRINADYVYNSDFPKLDQINQVLILLAVICNMVIGLSITQCNFLVGVVVLLVKLGMSTGGTHDSSISYSPTPSQNTIISDMPTSLADALKKFGVEGSFDMYAACPTCNFTNKATMLDNNGQSHYLETCANLVVGESGKSICGTGLLNRRSNGTAHPIKPYLVSSFHDYLARCLADPAYLGLSNKAADDAYEAINSGTACNDVQNVFEANFTSDFKGPDRSLFVNRGAKIRLAFSIHTDFLNPNGITHRGPTQSIGVISCANLAMDPSIRYLPEYMYIAGIIPGPKEPNVDEMDHFVRPVIEKFATVWKPGLKVSRTAESELETAVETGIFLSTNDLPAARKVAGFQGINSEFICTVCQLRGREQVMNTNHSHWPTRDVNELRRLAEQYRDAQTVAQRKSLFKQHGVRWSSFWMLEYWDPTKMLVIDAMHCILEGIVHYHCRHVLRLDTSASKTKTDSENFKYAYDWPWVDYSDDLGPPGRTLEEKDVPCVAKVQQALCISLQGDKSLTLEGLWTRLYNKPNLNSLHFVVHNLGLSLALNDIREEVADLYLKRVTQKSKSKNPETRFPFHKEANTKSHLVAILINWRLKQPMHASHNLPVTGTHDTLAHIRHIIATTQTPSWVNSVPKNYGDADAGTLKADKWRTLSTIYLPIALVTLWGDEHSPPSQDPAVLQSVLDHTMWLFQAVMIVCRNTMTTDRADAFREFVDKWVNNLRKVHPHTREHAARPNIHAAGHIYDFLICYGPILNWWCFPFERLVGTLQKINTSDHIGGVMESTIMKTLARTANIRRWLRRPECPEAVKQLKVLFDKCFVPANAPPPQEENHEMKGNFCAYAKHKCINFSGVHTHSGNSHIIYRPVGSPSAIAGQIEVIEDMSAERGTPILVHVRPFLPLVKPLSDPFLCYPHFQATTYSSQLSDEKDIIGLDRIISHAARFDYSYGRSVLVDLSRH
ncbi:hypothetical protein D9758_018788 [Tetrapyrgos nigripes]|uniref:Uncharacterized protein n=1 Tax=Tetrapyrgos nigripes TaxID=182062 RepID=A0A8H5B7A6_9AGAR|nr:hypothetical protein D9758_018788 [Tetrapyrgos nigripes]